MTTFNFREPGEFGDGATMTESNVTAAAARLQEALDAFDADVDDHMANESERADLWCDMDANAEDIRTVLEALALRTPSDGVKVKPLEWHGPDVNGDRHATSIFGTYTIRKQQGSMGFWLTQVGGYHRTVADAEAAAQADHTARILSALSPGKE